MPSCATRILGHATLGAVLTVAAGGCERSATSQTVSPEPTHLTNSAAAAPPVEVASAGRVAAPQSAPPPTSSGAAGTPQAVMPSTGTADAASPFLGGAGTPAGAGTFAAPPNVRVPIRDAATVGGGECGNSTVAQFIARAQQARPELRGIDLVPSTQSPGDASATAYLEPDGTFSVVFRSGDGDCFSGCIDNSYWYFAAGAQCLPEQRGYYARKHDNEANCVHESGTSLWSEPGMLDPMLVCGADLKPQNIAGSYKLQARGVIQPCARSGEKLPAQSIDKAIQLEIVQDAMHPDKGTVTLSDVGHPLIDGRKLSASILRRHITLHTEESNTPSTCLKQSQLDLDYDFEAIAARRLYLMQVDTPDCTKPDDYCKGYVELGLSEP